MDKENSPRTVRNNEVSVVSECPQSGVRVYVIDRATVYLSLVSGAVICNYRVSVLHTKTVTACTNCTNYIYIYQFLSFLVVFGSYLSHTPSK